jgi:hypothetical protein
MDESNAIPLGKAINKPLMIGCRPFIILHCRQYITAKAIGNDALTAPKNANRRNDICLVFDNPTRDPAMCSHRQAGTTKLNNDDDQIHPPIELVT